jgi:hypothetical protein
MKLKSEEVAAFLAAADKPPRAMTDAERAYVDSCAIETARRQRWLDHGIDPYGLDAEDPEDPDWSADDEAFTRETELAAEGRRDFLRALRTLPEDEAEKLLGIIHDTAFRRGFNEGVEWRKAMAKVEAAVAEGRMPGQQAHRPVKWTQATHNDLLCDIAGAEADAEAEAKAKGNAKAKAVTKTDIYKAIAKKRVVTAAAIEKQVSIAKKRK